MNIVGGKMILRSTKRMGLLIALVFMSSIVARSQNVSKGFCEHIKHSVVEKLNPKRIRTADQYSNECVFEFTVADDVESSLDIEKLDTVEASHNSIDRFLELLAVGTGLTGREQLRFSTFDYSKRWDEIFFLRGTSTNGAVLLLRRNRVRVTILASNEALMAQLEKLLGNLGPSTWR